jgi:hypothetical protein
MTRQEGDEVDPIQFGREFVQRLAENMCAGPPIRWAYLDRVLLDWWYESVIEPYRASDDGMPERSS